MRFETRFLAAGVCWMVLSMCGCGDDDAAADAAMRAKDAGKPDASAAADAGGSEDDAAVGAGRTGDAGAGTVVLAGRLIDYTSQDPIDGANLCITIPHASKPTCTKSASDGSYSIDIPKDEDVAVTVQASGYLDAIIPEHVTTRTALTLSPVTVADLKMVTSAVDVTIDAKRGHLALNIPAPGATFDVTPASGTLLYFDAAGAPSKTETKTTASGLAAVFNADPGTYEATYQAAGHSCAVSLGWHSTKPNTVRAPVIAGAITSVGMSCL
jgi:hypothetical protein